MSEPDADAASIRNTLQDLNQVLRSPDLGADTETVVALRTQTMNLLGELRADIEELKRINAADTFGTDPTFSHQRMTLTRRMEAAKIEYEFDVVPALARLTTGVYEQTKETGPNEQVVSRLNESPGAHWTAAKVLDSAEKFIASASTAAGIVQKGYPLVKALALMAGVVLP